MATLKKKIIIKAKPIGGGKKMMSGKINISKKGKLGKKVGGVMKTGKGHKGIKVSKMYAD